MQPIGALLTSHVRVWFGCGAELFAPCEYAFAYWYLGLICGMQMQLHKRVAEQAERQSATSSAAHAAEAAAGGKKSRKDAAKAKAKPPPGPEVVAELAVHNLDLLFTSVVLDLSRGTHLLLAALSSAGVLPDNESEFMPLARRFDRRFAPFRALQRPPPLTYEQYAEASAELAGAKEKELLQLAANHFKAAKLRLDAPLKGGLGKDGELTAAQRTEARALAKVAVANGVFIATLGIRPAAAGSTLKCSFETHGHFAVVSIVQ